MSENKNLKALLNPAGVVAAVAGGSLDNDVSDGGEVHVGSADVSQTDLSSGAVHVVTAA